MGVGKTHREGGKRKEISGVGSKAFLLKGQKKKRGVGGGENRICGDFTWGGLTA